MPRFFIEQVVPADAEVLTLGADDTHHACQVLRLKQGDEIEVCDDHHTLHRCVIRDLPKRQEKLTVQIIERQLSDSEPPYEIILYQALPKGDKMTTVIRMAVELGVTQIVPVLAERSVSRPTEKKLENRRQRWQNVAEAAAKQCGRARVPQVLSLMTVAESLTYLDDIRLEGKSGSRQLVDGPPVGEDILTFIPYEGEDAVSLHDYLNPHPRPNQIAFFVGPEGGFSAAEIDQFMSAGLSTVSLGPRILRTETAAAAVLSMLSYHYELT
ncbi:MAG: 16S rRNA (uracil(1498)-N(3))-methyltransferase [Clostridiaceae bacterium]|nr:16S rRNA (uracil(1498)-N(3))-methyltransferase [Clostridiaceae bacterium]